MSRRLPDTPGEEPFDGRRSFRGPVGYILQSACYGGTRVDLVPFKADDRSDLDERVYVRFRPAGGERYAVVAWERKTERQGIFPAATVHENLNQTLAMYPALRERAAAFESATVRKFPSSHRDGGEESMDGVVLKLPPFHRTPGLFSFGFGEEVPYIGVTPLEMDGVSHLLFQRSGYHRSRSLPLLNAMARHRPLRPGLLELGSERSGFAIAMHPGDDPRARSAGFDRFPGFRECLTYAEEIHAASEIYASRKNDAVRRATVGPTPGKTLSGLQAYTLQYLQGGATVEIVPFFLDGDEAPERVYVRYASPNAENHAVVSWVGDGRWERRLAVTPFEDGDSLVAAYPILQEAVAAAEAGETWRLPPSHRVEDIFQNWRCCNRLEVTAAPVEVGGVLSIAFEWRVLSGKLQSAFLDTGDMNPICEGGHPALRESLDNSSRLFWSAGTVRWRKVLDRRFDAVCGQQNVTLRVLPIRDETGCYFLLIRRETDRSYFTLITWREDEEARPADTSGEYPGLDDLLHSHPELEASLICAHQRLVMDCRHARPGGSR